MHTVSPGQRIQANDINQFVGILGTPTSDSIFGTKYGQLTQNGNRVDIGRSLNIPFKQIDQVIDAKNHKKTVVIALGKDYSQALDLLDADKIYSVVSGEPLEISTWNWYGYKSEDDIPADLTAHKSSGYAITNISSFGISGDVIYGYNIQADKDEESNKIFAVSLENEDVVKKELSNEGFDNIRVLNYDPLAIKTPFSIQNYYKSYPTTQDPMQFDLRAVVETRQVSSDAGDKTQYKYKAQWYSNYDQETQDQEYGAYFNNRELKYKSKTGADITPGWNTFEQSLSGEEGWQDSLSVDLCAYLEVGVGLIGVEDKSEKEEPDEWRWNEDKTYYSISLSALSIDGIPGNGVWVRRGSVIPGSGAGTETSAKYSDCYLTQNFYKLGEIHIRDANVDVDQIFNGTQTYVSPFYLETSSDIGKPKELPDSELSDIKLSSLERHEYVITSEVSVEVSGEVSSTTISSIYRAWSLYDLSTAAQQFHNFALSSENEEGEPDNKSRDFVIREYDDSGAIKIAYANLSTINVEYYGDSYLTGPTATSSIVITSADGGAHIVSLYNFGDPDKNFNLNLKVDDKGVSESYKFLVRDDDKKKLRYAGLSIDISDLNDKLSANARTDSEVPPLELSSLQRVAYTETSAGISTEYKVYELYKFERPDIDLTIGPKDANDPQNSNFKFLVRDDARGELRYAVLSGLSGGDAAVDSQQVYPDFTKSLEVCANASGENYIELYRFKDPEQLQLKFNDVSGENSMYKILVRNDDLDELQYANFDPISTITGDANIGESYSISSYDSNTKMKLYRFDENSDTQISINFANQNFTAPYWRGENGLFVTATAHGASNNAEILNRFADADAGNVKKLDYSTVKVQLPRYSVGDSNIDNSSTKSISSFVAGSGDQARPQYKVYNFDTTTVQPQDIKITAWQDYYTDGATAMDVPIDGEFIMRRSDGQKFVDYAGLSIAVPPFTHGDGDDYAAQDTHSIESKPNYTSPDRSYYQLYKFSNYQYDNVRSTLLSGDYIDLANNTKTTEGSHLIDFVVRNRQTGDIEYKQIAAKFDGSALEVLQDQIDDLESDVAGLEQEVQDLGGDVDGLREDVDALSDEVAGMDSKYWHQGGSNSNCYGSSIGNTNKDKVIDLDNKKLEGNWTVTNLSATSVATDSLNPNTGSSVTLGGNIDGSSQYSIQNLGSLHVATGGVIQIGSTTITESQLQQLLALLNASNNVLTAEY